MTNLQFIGISILILIGFLFTGLYIKYLLLKLYESREKCWLELGKDLLIIKSYLQSESSRHQHQALLLNMINLLNKLKEENK